MTYTVTVTDAQGCEDIASVTVNVDDSDVPGNNDCHTSPPPNDNPCNATLLNVYTTPIYTSGNNYCATNSSVPNYNCDGISNGDIWHRYITPSSGYVLILVEGSSLIKDMGMELYINSCANPTYYGCYPNTDPSTSVYMPYAIVENMPAGTEVLIRLWEYGNNNFGPFQISVTDLGGPTNPNDLPDLTVVVDDLSDIALNQGQTINVDFTISNISSVDATEAFVFLVWLSSDPIPNNSNSDVAFIDGYGGFLYGLNGNQSYGFDLDITVPDAEDGHYYLIVEVDTPLNSIVESNEKNNYISTSVTVGNIQPTGSDLEVDQERALPYTGIAPGMEIELSCDIENNGNERTEDGGRVAFYFSEDGKFEPGIDLFLGHRSFGKINPDDDSPENYTIEAPLVSSTGSKRIFFFADYQNNIEEYDETNNVESATIFYNTTQPILPDYIGDSITIEQGGILCFSERVSV